LPQFAGSDAISRIPAGFPQQAQGLYSLEFNPILFKIILPSSHVENIVFQ
jgi:hypothetical protein